KFRTCTDHLSIWPVHDAGSSCAKSQGSMPQSTRAHEKLFNVAFAEQNEESFVSRVLENQPVPPRYFALMKRINRNGAELPRTPLPDFLAVAELEEGLECKTSVVDVRRAQNFAAGRIPGTL